MSHLLLIIVWRFVPLHMKVGCCKIGQQGSKSILLYVDSEVYGSPVLLNHFSSSTVSTFFFFFFMKEGWWRIDVLVNINTALASITKPWAINTEEWSQPSIRFRGGHHNHQPPHTHPFPCSSLMPFWNLIPYSALPSRLSHFLTTSSTIPHSLSVTNQQFPTSYWVALD